MVFSSLCPQLPTKMAGDHQTTTKLPGRRPHSATAFQCHTRRRVFFLPTRRHNKVHTVRLGGKKPRRGVFLVKVLKKMRLKWLKLQYTCVLKKMMKYYKELIKDLIEAGSTVEALQQRLFMESTFAVPVMGVSFTSFPDRPRPLFF